MAAPSLDAVNVVEQRRVSPPPGSVSSSTLNLTFFDVLCLQIPPVQRLFFFDFSGISTDEFRSSDFSLLERSLSLALSIFYPLAGRLVPVPGTDSGDHVIRYSDGDYVSLTLAESRADHYCRVTGNQAKDASESRSLVPPLLLSSKEIKPLAAFQVTVFPGSGVSIGATIDHVAADGSSSVHFMKSWAAIFKSGGDPSAVKRLPVFDRSLVGDLELMKRDCLEALKRLRVAEERETDLGRVVRSTFVLTRSHLDHLRNHLTSRSPVLGPRPSTFLVTCAYTWVCAIKASSAREGTRRARFSFAVDCRTRLHPAVPDAYFGNCIGGTSTSVGESELLGENGLVSAAEAIHRAIRGLDAGVLEAARTLVGQIETLLNERDLSVAGSPRFHVYDLDFGWGRPRKVEIVSIEKTSALSLAESRDEEGGVEIGKVGQEDEMTRFASSFEEGLKSL